MKKIILVSDFFFEDIQGGGEISDAVLYNILNTNGFNCIKKRCFEINNYFIESEKNNLWIISNFISLSEEIKNQLITKCSYIIYEHDYKCFAERHPTRYKEYDYYVGKDQHRNFTFYNAAKLVVCQTDLQKQIIEKNLRLKNCWSLNGNLYSEHELLFFESHRNEEKNGLYAIVNDDNPIKGKKDAIRYADKNKLQYSLIYNKSRLKFFEELSKYNGIILMPTILESCSRLAIEAKLMGLKVISRNCPIMLIDFDLKSIKECRKKVLDKILETWKNNEK